MANRFLSFWLGKAKEPEDGSAVAVETVERRGNERRPALGQVDLQWVGEDGETYSIKAAMVDRSTEGLRVVSSVEFNIGDELFIVLPKDSETKAAVRHSGESQDGWQVGLRLIQRDRRRFQRFPANGKALMHWSGGHYGAREVTVEVQNIAEDGLQLKCPEEVPSGTTVKLTGESMECVGVTWYCRPDTDAEGFIIGMQMSRDAYQKDSLDFDQ